jgi:hypothetical protein
MPPRRKPRVKPPQPWPTFEKAPTLDKAYARRTIEEVLHLPVGYFDAAEQVREAEERAAREKRALRLRRAMEQEHEEMLRVMAAFKPPPQGEG